MVSRYSAYRGGSDTVPPDIIDRILVGACAAIWLVLLGTSVAAAVALADLGSGFHQTPKNAHTASVARSLPSVKRTRQFSTTGRRRHRKRHGPGYFSRRTWGSAWQ